MLRERPSFLHLSKMLQLAFAGVLCFITSCCSQQSCGSTVVTHKPFELPSAVKSL